MAGFQLNKHRRSWKVINYSLSITQVLIFKTYLL